MPSQIPKNLGRLSVVPTFQGQVAIVFDRVFSSLGCLGVLTHLAVCVGEVVVSRCESRFDSLSVLG